MLSRGPRIGSVILHLCSAFVRQHVILGHAFSVLSSCLTFGHFQTAFIPFITAGDPDLATTSKALKILDSCGSDVIELGVPYSDPLADGPVIQASVSDPLHICQLQNVCARPHAMNFGLTPFQASATRALKKGTTLDSVIEMLKEVIPELSSPIVIFTYYNPILKRGVQNFMATIKQVGVHGKFIFLVSHTNICYL